MSQDAPIPKDLWDLIPPAAQAALLLAFDALYRKIDALEKQVAELTARLNQHSGNSSKPPSSDAPNVKPRPPKEPSGKKRGAQPGHERHQRPPLPPDDIEHIKPTECRKCGQQLTGTDLQPLRHQVIELPEIKPYVVDYLLHRLTCNNCGTSTCAALPEGVPQGQHGPNLQALVTLLTGGYRLSKRLVESLLSDVLGIDLCIGSVCNLEQQTTEAIAPVVDELRQHVQTQHAHIDETGWRENRRRAWLWGVVTKDTSLFHIDRFRSGDVARSLVGPDRRQVVTSDRYSAYKWLRPRSRQLCWAHLQRDFQAMIDRHNAGTPIGKQLLVFSDDMFTLWYRVRDGTLNRSTFRRTIDSQRPWFRDVLTQGSACACAKTAAVCRELLSLECALWTFTRVEGVEPTNNAAERSLRHAVLWRKSSYGTDSSKGSRFVASILSVVATCRQQGKNVLDFLKRCCQAYLQGRRHPSLLPA